jgi:hypothetical protein
LPEIEDISPEEKALIEIPEARDALSKQILASFQCEHPKID